MSDSGDILSMWVIYFDPTDYPQKWVVRRWDVGHGIVRAQPKAAICDSLRKARTFIPFGLVRLDRMEADEPQIKEVWL
jgi:hypothetical protein